MNDEELTALAAKAYGNALAGFSPLTDDGDALRLAVRLRLGLIPLEGGGWDVVRFDNESCGEDGGSKEVALSTSDCPLRAITRAAAEIGRARA